MPLSARWRWSSAWPPSPRPTTPRSRTSRSPPRSATTGRSGRRGGVAAAGRRRIAAGSGTRSTPSSWRGSSPTAWPAPEADRPTLLRRLSFDLTGLPPSPEEVEAFLRDRSPDAYEKVVDRLLASPQYGVRRAQHWLDLARYADTDGFEFDQARPNAWRYRDWVVNALNRDMPYDRFVRLQLAGDEIAPEDPSAFVATGFNRCYPDMVDLNDQRLRRQNALNDITETTGLVFLGLTIGCARCHDHKFDPIRQADFYRLQAFFAGSRFRDDYPAGDARASGRRTRRRRAPGGPRWRQDPGGDPPHREAGARPARPGPADGRLDDAVAAYNTPESERTRPRSRRSTACSAATGGSGPPTGRGYSAPPQPPAGRLLAELDRVMKVAPRPLPTARGIDESRRPMPRRPISSAAASSPPGPAVAPAFPAVLATASRPRPPIAPEAGSSGRRQALADWLTRPDHPMTARVMVNRLWQGHFGRGLVGTSSDFGTMGDEPSHPELLDWLATELVARGWSLKSMHRLIVTSATYRQSSRPDRRPSARPTRRTAGSRRQNRRRLDGESIRDALLAASGRLNPALGGPGVFPALPPELTKLSSKGAIWPVSVAGRRSQLAAASMSSSGETCAIRSSRPSTGRTRTRAARSGRSPRSRPRP